MWRWFKNAVQGNFEVPANPRPLLFHENLHFKV